MEGRVFRCTWTQVGSRFRVWVRQRPKLAGEGETFAEADEALWGTILDELGDGESERQYDPPRPADTRLLEILSDRLVLAFAPLYGAPYWPRETESLFTEGSCSRCGNPQGDRTDVPLPLSWVSSDHDIGSVGIRGARQAWQFTFVSDRFLAQLTPVVRHDGHDRQHHAAQRQREPNPGDAHVRARKRAIASRNSGVCRARAFTRAPRAMP